MSEENQQLYYYHGDHLGSAQIVTDPEGEIYEQLEYTPYGELWVEHLETTIETTPFRFTGKERDSETGLYYYGARYLNPQTSMWLSADPAMGEYIPQAPINDEAKKYNKELPGLGGVYNYVNLHAYHYSFNNPVRYIDPTGLSGDELDIISQAGEYIQNVAQGYIDSLKDKASVSGRATFSMTGDITIITISGVKVKISVALVAEAVDFWLGTPGQELVRTGAEITVGLRGTIGRYQERENDGIGLRNISLAINGRLEIAGVGAKLEYRRQIVNFDTAGGPRVTFLDANINKLGLSKDIRTLGPGKITVGGRVNGF